MGLTDRYRWQIGAFSTCQIKMVKWMGKKMVILIIYIKTRFFIKIRLTYCKQK